jgi:hypothetical protein
VTKHDAAIQALGIAVDVDSAASDDEASGWILRLLWLAEGLDPSICSHPEYGRLAAASVSDSTRAKLRRLIEHPSTPAAEREAAVAALDRIRSARV